MLRQYVICTLVHVFMMHYKLVNHLTLVYIIIFINDIGHRYRKDKESRRFLCASQQLSF